ncbi:MAG: HAMP domain-containing protein [Betaproteobacteria bacterium]|nr:MAG: HAMP domain-containing protein [Betaproteobacteria bacterium]
MRGTLANKLIAALVVLLGVTSMVYAGLTVIATRFHIQEINQSLNRSLANNIVESQQLMRGGEADPAALHQVFESLMKVNPAIEVYLLDPGGEILAYSAPPTKVKRARVSIDSVEAFLAGDESFPIRGDDPRHLEGRKVFSAAPILDDGRLQGYLYVVLGGETYDTISGMFERSYILRLTLGGVAVSLLLIGTAGALYFHRLTRRLRRLAMLMNELRSNGFQRPVGVPEQWFHTSGDEIDRLGRMFDEMAQRIVDQIKQLQNADSSRRELFANISHDLRTPLASLHGAIQTLLMKEAELPETEKRRYLQLALNHSEHLGRLTRDLFELATLESADRKLHFESFSIAEIAHDVAQKFRPEADRRKLTIECDVPQDTPYIAADIGLIERVFENLIENAIRYTPEGGTIRLSVIPGQESVSAQVADTGRGISAADLPRIFDRRYRTEKDRKDRPAGTGLGLAIAKKILQLHGGSMEVESVVGVGTTFRFNLPAESERTQLGEV